MASLVNKWFHQTKKNEQNLLDSLVQESIQLQGSTYHYLPRDVQIQDLVIGEDVISNFGLAIPIEMYLADSQGFQGDKEMFSKFGLELRNSYKLVVHKGRWEKEVKTQFDAFIANGEASFSIQNYIRPREGDLIYDPMTKYLMEIKFVDHDNQFYALGKNYQYYLTCEAFQYNNEKISTGVIDIDIFNTNSTDKLANQVLMEDASFIVFEQGGYLVLEDGNQLPVIRDYGTNFVPDATTIKSSTIDPFGL